VPQTSISERLGTGYAGQIAEGGPRFLRSARAEGSGISAGKPVKRGTSAAVQVKAFEAGDTPTAGMFAGVVVWEQVRPTGGIAAGDSVQVMRFGSCYMEFSEAVTAGEQVGITLASGALVGIPQGTAAGAITTGIVVLPGLRIASTTSTSGVAVVEVNLFGSQDAATVGSL
jgi:hypothetical protein